MPNSLAVWMSIIVILLICYAVVEVRAIRNQQPRHLHGWWHYQSSGPGFRWQPRAWKDACEQSAAKSRERRGIDADH